MMPHSGPSVTRDKRTADFACLLRIDCLVERHVMNDTANGLHLDTRCASSHDTRFENTNPDDLA